MKIGAIIFGIALGVRGLWFLIFVRGVAESRLDRVRVVIHGSVAIVSAMLALLGAFVFRGSTGALLLAAVALLVIQGFTQRFIGRVEIRREEKQIGAWVKLRRDEKQ